MLKKRYIILVILGVLAWQLLNKQSSLSYEVKESVLQDWDEIYIFEPDLLWGDNTYFKRSGNTIKLFDPEWIKENIDIDVAFKIVEENEDFLVVYNEGLVVEDFKEYGVTFISVTMNKRTEKYIYSFAEISPFKVISRKVEGSFEIITNVGKTE